MIPGQAVKEIIAEDVDGYLVVDGTIYYAQGGKIHSAASGTETAVGEESYKVQIRDGSCYLTDSLGNIVTPENGTVVEMGDRSYRLEENGAIRYVKRRDVSVNGVTFRLKREGTGMMVLMESDGASRAGITGEYGVQSFCIVDNFIFTVLMWIKEQMENGTAGFSGQILMEKEKRRSAECFREP